jgi:hypothetical protein
MKIMIRSKLLALTLIALTAWNSSAQLPTYSCVANNGALITKNVYQFDIYLYQTGSTPLYLNNYQLAFRILNTALATNGGAISGSYIPGTSQLTGLNPSNVVVAMHANSVLLRINGPAASLAGLSIPASGLRVGTFRINNTADFGASNVQLEWSATGPYNTRVYALINGMPKEITDVPAYHSMDVVLPVVPEPLPEASGDIALNISDEYLTIKDPVVENYPNPFDNKTNIVFVIPDNAQTTLEVFDLSGKLLQTLFKGEAKAKEKYKLEFDGSAHPAGIYIYRLTAGDKTLTGKMILNRD